MCPVCSTNRSHKEMEQKGDYFECGCGFAKKIEEDENNG
jgi:hypothetical protein